jgi:CDP-diacylglycerol---serine O-phosphatidyltransferase
MTSTSSLKPAKRKKRLLIGVRPLPTMITLGNLLCGFASIVFAMNADHPPANFSGVDCLYAAGMLIFMAMIFDVFDGRVARWTKSTSRFGMEMDSLADVVSFGVAPAVLVWAAIDTMGVHPIPARYVWLLLAVYVCCAALRLARYNVEAETGHRDFFFGLPSPAAAGCAASLVVLITQGVEHHLPRLVPPQMQVPMGWVEGWREQCSQIVLIGMPFVLLCLGILMVSRVHYLHVGDRLLGGRRSLMHLLLLVLLLVLVAMMHEVMLAVVFNGYLLLGLVNEVRFQLFPSTRPAGWVASSEELLAHGSGPDQPGNEPPRPDTEAPPAPAPSGGKS